MKRLFTLWLFAFSFLTALLAVPAKRNLVAHPQPDGTTVLVKMVGDEFFHYRTTADGIPVVADSDGTLFYATSPEGSLIATTLIAHNAEERNDAEKELVQEILTTLKNTPLVAKSKRRNTASRSALQTQNTFPTQGNVKFLILLVSFKDVEFKISNPADNFTRLANEAGYSDFDAEGSVRDYFSDQSNGTFQPHFDVVGPVQLSQKLSYYGGNDSNGDDVRPREMVREACQLAKQQFNIDFSNYDADGDNVVDCVYVIYAGYAESETGNENDIWPHQWSIDGTLTLDGKRISKYACSNELKSKSETPETESIGVLCHEFSHVLGLPDFYATQGVGTFGLDVWSIMDYGCYNNSGKTPCNMTAYERSALGWGTLTEHPFPKSNIKLRSLSDSQDGVRISSPLANEYFVLQNRRKSGWDKYIPAEGLMILHVDYNSYKWTNNIINNDPNHLNMRLVPADNATPMYTDGSYLYSLSLKGDLYPGPYNNTSFTNESVPAAKLWNKSFLSKPVTNIRLTDGVISYDFGATTALDEKMGISEPPFRIANRRLTILPQELTQVGLFTITGVRVPLHGDPQEGLFSETLQPGVYLLQLGNRTTKVLIPTH